MIQYKKHLLENGLRVVVHQDKTTPFAALNVLYRVGAKDESPDQTGFAHFFEHLMFGGSINIPDYDHELQKVGGNNNAFTSNDITNYYLTLPADNIETGFWLESDRMLSLAFSEKSFLTQQQVVIEEFRQNYINQPYGDIWHLIRKQAYEKHPYQWPTIGKEIKHIEDSTLEDVKTFFYEHYAPNNAILVASGNVEFDQIVSLAEKWFGSIPSRAIKPRNYPSEPKQKGFKTETVYRDVPNNMLIWSWHMGAKNTTNYRCGDFTSDILASGNSSRFYQKLVVEKQLFIDIDAFISGEEDPGLFLIIGKPSDGVDLEEAKKAVFEELEALKNNKIVTRELEKIKNKFEANLLYSESSYLDKAMQLAAYELSGDIDLINTQVDKYREITGEQLQEFAHETFTEDNCNEIFYLSNTTKES
ncbi:insulinase family protein [Halosquirtibacter laminarini]|uniref:Insulinase family protein n=1 Tax=Halosquirtibacter laminarini TaxID=3374600 RepID=A0AC61NFG7_9BACT|nr:insulinase family protein [Prolixibacteraceae bacterium]